MTQEEQETLKKAQNLIVTRDEEIKEWKRQVDEIVEQLKTANTVSNQRKKDYDDLIEFLATKLGVGADINIIKAQIQLLVDIEKKVNDFEDQKKKIESANLQAKQQLQEEIDLTRQDVLKASQTHLEAIGEIMKKIDTTQEKIGLVKKTEKQTSKIAQIITAIKKKLNIK